MNDSIPPRGSNSNRVHNPEALRMHSASILLPPLLRLDLLRGASAPPPLLEALTSPRSVRVLRTSTLTSTVISITAPSACLASGMRSGVGGNRFRFPPPRASYSHNRTAHSRPPCRLSVPMLAITVQAREGPDEREDEGTGIDL